MKVQSQPSVEASGADIATDDASMPAPRISVLLPLVDRRGLGLGSIESWVNNGATDPSSYEIVAVLDEASSDIQFAAREVLRPQDRLLTIPSENEIELIHAAACQARGDILFFSEGHCAALPGTVNATLDWFATSDGPGFFPYASSIARNELSTFEERMFEREFRSWEEPGAWERFHLRGTAILKSRYVAVGGLPHRYGRFAEWLLSARLDAAGDRLLPLRTAEVQHVNAEEFTLFRSSVGEFTRGESLYRLEETDRWFAHKYFGAPSEWAAALFGFHAPIRPMLMAAARLPAAPAQSFGKIMRRWVIGRSLPVAVDIEIMARKLLVRRAGSYLRRFQHFERYYALEAARGRLQVASRAMPPVDRRCQYTIADLEEPELFGFHPREQHSGQWFRWSEPVSAIRLRVEPNDYSALIQLDETRPLSAIDAVSVYLGRRKLRIDRYNRTRSLIQLRIPRHLISADEPNWLIVACRPWQVHNPSNPDRRALGLPIVQINLEPLRPRA